MKVKVIQRFADESNFTIQYKVGQVVEFQIDRAKELIARGLVEEVGIKPKPGKK